MTSKVSVIITSYLSQSLPYLDLCVRSVKNSIVAPLEIIIVSPEWYHPAYHDVRTIHPIKENYSNAHALNFGVENASKDAEYFLLLNDDVILTAQCLGNLVSSSQLIEDHCCMMGIGNDQQQRYSLRVPYVSPRPYRIEQLTGHEKMLLSAVSPYDYGLMFFDTLCLYAVLIPRKVFEDVGPFTEGWHDDIDWTRRARARGYMNAVTMNALHWHAGGVSADITLGALDSEERQKSLKSYNDKWGTT